MTTQPTSSPAKDFINTHRFGILSTHSELKPGYPFGSIVPYLLDQDGSIIIFISLMAEHYKNLTLNPKASLIVVDSLDELNALAKSRATLLLDFERVALPEVDTVRARYEARLPGVIAKDIEHNFVLMRGKINSIRWIGGFGDMRWIAGSELST